MVDRNDEATDKLANLLNVAIEKALMIKTKSLDKIAVSYVDQIDQLTSNLSDKIQEQILNNQTRRASHMKKLTFILLLVMLLLVQTTAHAQKFTRKNYLDFLPPSPKIITQTQASQMLHLYGDCQDSSYQDSNPMDGIDDHRKLRLDSLAAMFSPILRKNNFSTPQDFEKMLRIRYNKDRDKIYEDSTSFLFVDTWDLTKASSELVSSDSIKLGLPDQPLDRENDEKLKMLILEFHPDSFKTQKIHPERHFKKSLFFDFPGNCEKSWKKIYQKVDEKKSKIYAHFLVHEPLPSTVSARFELAIQYWVFYPFNDGANNHEGDWEHITVRITTLERKGGLFTDHDIERILDHTNTEILDSLIIKKVDYYFHHAVISLDYQAVDFFQDRKSFLSSLREPNKERLLQSWINEQIYNRIHMVKDSINTHPIGYIAGDNMGLDQLIKLPGGKNRNPHGNYPFPGIWKHIGPAGATEKINGEKTLKFVLPPIDKPKFISVQKVKTEQYYRSEKNPNFITYTRSDIILIPDWERVIDLALTYPEVRRKWFWNSAPPGPAYNTAWNRVGPTSGFEEYNPHVFPKQFLFGFQDNFLNKWGFLNLTLPTFISMPIINLGWSISGGWFGFKPKFYPRQELPFRYVSFVYRPFHTISDNDFVHLLPDTTNPTIQSFVLNYDGYIDGKSFKHKGYTSYGGFMININLGRYSSENTFSMSNSKLKYKIRDGADKSVGQVEGDLSFYEFYGSFKYCFSRRNFKPFLRGGYGWSIYRVKNMTLNGEPFDPEKTQWFHNTIFPNTGHLGAGFELFASQNNGIMRKRFLGRIYYIGEPEFGIRIEYTFHFHKLGKDAPINDWIYRHEFGVGLVVSF